MIHHQNSFPTHGGPTVLPLFIAEVSTVCGANVKQMRRGVCAAHSANGKRLNWTVQGGTLHERATGGQVGRRGGGVIRPRCGARMPQPQTNIRRHSTAPATHCPNRGWDAEGIMIAPLSSPARGPRGERGWISCIPRLGILHTTPGAAAMQCAETPGPSRKRATSRTKHEMCTGDRHSENIARNCCEGGRFSLLMDHSISVFSLSPSRLFDRITTYKAID
jgi:hypothetical protein